MTMTFEKLMSEHNVEVPNHLVADAEIPVVAGKPQRQGDVFFLPIRPGKVEGLKPIPPEGIAVVRGEAGGNTHLLVGTGSWAPCTTDPVIQGTLVVEDGETAYLLHPEHGAQGFGTGWGHMRRQVEQADQIRLVKD